MLSNLALHIGRSIVSIIWLVHNVQYQLCIFADRLAVLAAGLSGLSQSGFAVLDANVVVPLASASIAIRRKTLHEGRRYGF